MFFCEPCRISKQWPQSLAVSLGECEMCGQTAKCNDAPSSRLTAATSAALEGRQLPEGYVKSDAVQRFLDKRKPS